MVLQDIVLLIHNNSSVRITTGKGRYGRAKDNVMDSYVGGVNSVVTAAISNIIGNVAGNITLGSSSNKSTGNNAANKVAGTKGVNGKIAKDDDVNTSCGYTVDQLKAAISSINQDALHCNSLKLQSQLNNLKVLTHYLQLQ